MIEIEIPMDIYFFERLRFACEKEGVNVEDAVLFFLHDEVGPTYLSEKGA